MRQLKESDKIHKEMSLQRYNSSLRNISTLYRKITYFARKDQFCQFSTAPTIIKYIQAILICLKSVSFDRSTNANSPALNYIFICHYNVSRTPKRSEINEIWSVKWMQTPLTLWNLCLRWCYLLPNILQ